jgi:NurA-like 5'-3' nuclease
VTTASLHREMVEALRYGVRHLRWWLDMHGGDAPRAAKEGEEKLIKMRAALEGWEKRPRLRDDEALRKQVARAVLDDLEDRRGIKWELRAVRRENPAIYAQIEDAIGTLALDALDAALYGERG